MTDSPPVESSPPPYYPNPYNYQTRPSVYYTSQSYPSMYGRGRVVPDSPRVQQVWQAHGPQERFLQWADSRIRGLSSSDTYNRQAEEVTQILLALQCAPKPDDLDKSLLHPITRLCLDAIRQSDNPHDQLLYLAKQNEPSLRALFLNSFLWKSVGNGYDQMSALLHLNRMPSNLDSLDAWSRLAEAIPESHPYRDKFATATRNIVCGLERSADRKRHHDLLTRGKLYLLASEKKWAVNWLCKACLARPNAETLALAIEIAHENQGEAMQMLVKVMIEDQQVFSSVERLANLWQQLEPLSRTRLFQDRLLKLLAVSGQPASRYAERMEALCLLRKRFNGLKASLESTACSTAIQQLMGVWSRRDLPGYLGFLQSTKHLPEALRLKELIELPLRTRDAASCERAVEGFCSKWAMESPEDYRSFLKTAGAFRSPEALYKSLCRVKPLVGQVAFAKELRQLATSRASDTLDHPTRLSTWREIEKAWAPLGSASENAVIADTVTTIKRLWGASDVDNYLHSLRSQQNLSPAEQLAEVLQLRQWTEAPSCDKALVAIRSSWADNNSEEYLTHLETSGAFASPETLVTRWQEVAPLVGKSSLTSQMKQLNKLPERGRVDFAARLRAWDELRGLWGTPDSTIDEGIAALRESWATRRPKEYLKIVRESGAFSSPLEILNHWGEIAPLVGKIPVTRELRRASKATRRRKVDAAVRLKAWKEIQGRWGRPNPTIEAALTNTIQAYAGQKPTEYLKYLEEIGALDSFASALKHEADLLPAKKTRELQNALFELCQRDDPSSEEALALLIGKGYLTGILSRNDNTAAELLVASWKDTELSKELQQSALAQTLAISPQHGGLTGRSELVSLLLTELKPSQVDARALRRLLKELAAKNPAQAHALMRQADALKIMIARRAALAAPIVTAFRKKGLHDEALELARDTLRIARTEDTRLLWKALLQLKKDKPDELVDLARQNRPPLSFWHRLASDSTHINADLTVECLIACRSQGGLPDSQSSGQRAVSKIIRLLDNQGLEKLATACPDLLLESGLISPNCDDSKAWDLSCTLVELLAAHLPGERMPELFKTARIPILLNLKGESFKAVRIRICKAFITAFDQVNDDDIRRACYPGLTTMVHLFINRANTDLIMQLPKRERGQLLVLWARSAPTAKDLRYHVRVLDALQVKRFKNILKLIKALQYNNPESLTHDQWGQLLGGAGRAESEDSVPGSVVVEALAACSIRYAELCSNATSLRERRIILNHAMSQYNRYRASEALQRVLVHQPLAKALEEDGKARLVLMHCQAKRRDEAMAILEEVTKNYKERTYSGDKHLLLRAAESTLILSTRPPSKTDDSYIKGLISCLLTHNLYPSDDRQELCDMLTHLGEHLIRYDAISALVTLQGLSAVLIGCRAYDAALALIQTRHKAAEKLEAESVRSYGYPGVVSDILLLNEIEQSAQSPELAEVSASANKLKLSYLDAFSKLPDKDPANSRLRRVLSLVGCETILMDPLKRLTLLDSLRRQALMRGNTAAASIVMGRQLYLDIRNQQTTLCDDKIPMHVAASYQAAKKLLVETWPDLVLDNTSQRINDAQPSDRLTVIMFCQAVECGVSQIASATSTTATNPLLTSDQSERARRQKSVALQLIPLSRALIKLGKHRLIRDVGHSEISCIDAMNTSQCHVARLQLLAGSPETLTAAVEMRKLVAGKLIDGTYRGCPRDVAFLYRAWISHAALLESPKVQKKLFPQLIKEARRCRFGREDANAICDLAFQKMLYLATNEGEDYAEASVALWDAVHDWSEAHGQEITKMFSLWLGTLATHPRGRVAATRAANSYVINKIPGQSTRISKVAHNRKG